MTEYRKKIRRKQRYAMNHDALTGLYNREKMFRETRRMVDAHRDIRFVFLRFDIDRLLMMQHPGRIFSAQNLYESVWEEPYFYSCNGTVMVHIRKLRVKIEKDPRNPKHIQTVWGKGYRFDGIGE